MTHILQQNVGRDPEALAYLMEAAVERRADLVLVQEPPKNRGYSHASFDSLWTEGRLITARRKSSD